MAPSRDRIEREDSVDPLAAITRAVDDARRPKPSFGGTPFPMLRALPRVARFSSARTDISR